MNRPCVLRWATCLTLLDWGSLSYFLNGSPWKTYHHYADSWFCSTHLIDTEWQKSCWIAMNFSLFLTVGFILEWCQYFSMWSGFFCAWDCENDDWVDDFICFKRFLIGTRCPGSQRGLFVRVIGRCSSFWTCCFWSGSWMSPLEQINLVCIKKLRIEIYLNFNCSGIPLVDFNNLIKILKKS